jgi:hypothetical protein
MEESTVNDHGLGVISRELQLFLKCLFCFDISVGWIRHRGIEREFVELGHTCHVVRRKRTASAGRTVVESPHFHLGLFVTLVSVHGSQQTFSITCFAKEERGDRRICGVVRLRACERVPTALTTTIEILLSLIASPARLHLTPAVLTECMEYYTVSFLGRSLENKG